jgi:DNA-binding beta-propeller fold protein YncE
MKVRRSKWPKFAGCSYLLSFTFLLLPTCAESQEVYEFERMWPVLQQPWYFDSPWGITVGSSGNVYITDSGIHRVLKFTADGQYITKWGSLGSGDGQFQNLGRIALDSNGNVYVVDYWNDRIQKFTPDGEFIDTWGTEGSGDGQFKLAVGIAIDVRGNVYVADTENHRIQKFTTDGQFITKWGTEGSSDGQFQGPAGIAIDSSGEVYVADTENHRIQKFTTDGQFITKWGTEGSSDAQFQGPKDIAIEGNGNVYVVDSGNHRVQKFTAHGDYITQWGNQGGGGEGSFETPLGIAIGRDGNVYVVDSYNKRIQEFTASGQFVTKWASEGSRNGQFSSPQGVALDSSGNVYVADSWNSRIQKFRTNGEYITQWGGVGGGNGEFVKPVGVAVDSRGNVYVVDSSLHRIQKFTANGQFIGEWGSFGNDAGEFFDPGGIAINSSGDVYVADTDNHRVQKFTGNGGFIREWGSYGSGQGQFSAPEDIAIDSRGNVYVVESGDGNDRIQKFTADGVFLTEWGGFGTVDERFYDPRALAIDGNDHVYVADTVNHRIQKFTADGQFLAKWGEKGVDPGNINSPSGIAVKAGRVYVSEQTRNRVQVFASSEAPNENGVDKAIIVAGGGPFRSNHIWDATQMNANLAFRALKYQGFTKESVYYLSADTDLDLDGNGVLDDVDGDATNEALRQALTNWATDADDVVVYLVDHGGNRKFRMSERETLQADELSLWLNNLQERISGKVVVIYDACESGSFVSQLLPPSGKQRMVITSTSPNEDARLLDEGAISFSYFFWTQVLQGGNVYDNFLIARDGVNYAPPGQVPLLDADGNGVSNEKSDQQLAQDYTIGAGILLASDTPSIGEVSPNQVLHGETSATIWAEDVVATGKIARVWAVITPPGTQACSPDIPVTSLPTLELRPQGNGRSEGIYTNFSTTGAYTVAVYAMDDNSHISPPKKTVVQQTTGTPLPDLKINGSDGHLGIIPSESVSVALALAAGRHAGEDSDWWVAAHTTPSGWFTFDIESGVWVPGLDLTVGYQGPLADRAAREILALPGLPAGRYTFYSVVDRTRNGVIDQPLSYDCLTVSSE